MYFFVKGMSLGLNRYVMELHDYFYDLIDFFGIVEFMLLGA